MNKERDGYLWGLTGIGAAGTLTILFSVASFPEQPDTDAINENAIETLALIDDVATMVGQNVPMSYDGGEYQISLQGVSKRIGANKAPETCYDYSVSRDDVTLTVPNFITVEKDMYGCTID